jgi:hypothetical protein
MSSGPDLERRARLWIVGACALYAALALAYALRLPLVMDEFQGAAAVNALRSQLPYRDFAPYKPVLGYYLQLLPLSLSPDPWTAMLSVKIFLVLLNAVAIYAAARLLLRHYRAHAVVLGTWLLAVMSTFVERSAELRVDMLTSLCGWFSLLALLGRRNAWAGALAGMSFLVSQKGVYFGLAAAAALGWDWAVVRRDRAALRAALQFAAGAALPVAAYLAAWSAASSLERVVHATFLASAHIALGDLYEIRHFWFQTGLRNPYFYATAALGLAIAYQRRRAHATGHADRTLWVYGAVLAGLCLWHKQPWPYFFVLLIPTLYVLTVVFFDAELTRSARLGPVWLGVYLLLGLAWPLARVPQVLARDNSFQRAQVRLAQRLLGPDDRYLAGLEMIYTRDQASDELRWLDMPRLRSLARRDPAELARLVGELRAAPPKLLIWDYRLAGLPEPLRAALEADWLPFHGNIRLYAPRVPAGPQQLYVPFEGSYALVARGPARIALDGVEVAPGRPVRLAAGSHRSESDVDYRLAWLPERDGLPPLDPAFRQPRPLFDSVYTY